MARTTPPLSITPLKARNSTSGRWKISVTSAMTSGLRRSGLSDPYFSMASSNGMRRNGGLSISGFVSRRKPPNSSKTPWSTGEMASKTSSWVTNDISKSSW